MLNKLLYRQELVEQVISNRIVMMKSTLIADDIREYKMRLQSSINDIEISETEFNEIHSIWDKETQVRHFISELRKVCKWQKSYAFDWAEEELFIELMKRNLVIDANNRHKEL